MKIIIVGASLLSLFFYVIKQFFLKRMHLHLHSWPKLLFELIILTVMPIPFYERVFLYTTKGDVVANRNTLYFSDFISAFMFARFYFLIRIILQPQKNKLKNSLMFTKNCKPSIWLSFKISLLKKS